MIRSHPGERACLPQVGRFPTHVGPSNDIKAAALCQVGVVGLKLGSLLLLQQRVAPLEDRYGASLGAPRADVLLSAAAHSLCKCAQHVQQRQVVGQLVEEREAAKESRPQRVQHLASRSRPDWYPRQPVIVGIRLERGVPPGESKSCNCCEHSVGGCSAHSIREWCTGPLSGFCCAALQRCWGLPVGRPQQRQEAPGKIRVCRYT